jgi:hypothetical protein
MVAAGQSTDAPLNTFDSPVDQATTAEPEAIIRFREQLAEGRPWVDALLEAVGSWRLPHELVDGHEYVYLIAGEAFDWLALASRLLAVAPESVLADDRERLLFQGALPAGVSESQFREALGTAKYRAHLNYFYGIVVEEALWLSMEREVAKERGVRGLHHGLGVHDVISQRLYGADQASLVRRFRRTQGQKVSISFTLSDWKAFTYWLFKHRLSRCDSARIASDTRKGLRLLQEIRDASGEGDRDIPQSLAM